MPSKTKALLDITRFLVSIIFGVGLYYQWKSLRPYDPPTYPYIAGVVGFILLFLLFRVFSKGEGSG
ncbi:MAG: hypothetical protein N3D10_03360 [Candidatus Micrarchaeota archaeon]|nr:hypothetical protein [Candidatus Micrarchaeota archaeon]